MNSRNKGANFERKIAALLGEALGLEFKRDLDQYRERARGDLVCSDPDFPFLIECKRYARGAGCSPAWWRQASLAATGAGLYPAVIYKFDRQPVCVRLLMQHQVQCVSRGRWSAPGHPITTDLDGFAYIAREGLTTRKGNTNATH